MTSSVRLLLLLSACLAAAVPVHARDVEVVSSTSDAVVLLYEPPGASLRAVTAAGREYVSVSVPGTELLGIPGAPELPVVRVTVAIPDCDGVDLAVSTGSVTRHDGVRVIPSPSAISSGREALSDTRFVEGAQYASAGLWPPGAAAMQGPGFVADQRVVDVVLHPCQVDAAAGAVVVNGSIRVTLSFRGVREHRDARPGSPRSERMLRTVLANYEDGKAWRCRSVASSTGRPEEYFSTSPNWAKLRVSASGMHSIGHSDLQGAGIPPGSVDPRTVRVFTGNGMPLAEDFSVLRPSWMEECSILVHGEADGSFDANDAIVFYALAADGWSGDLGLEGASEPFYESPYSNETVYWLTWESPGTPSGFAEPPRRMEEDDLQSSPSPLEADSYRARAHFERNIYEWQGRSDNWFWHEMKQSPLPERRYFHESLDHVRADSMALLRVRVDGSSSVPAVNPDHHAVFYLNGTEAYVGEWDGQSSLVFEADSQSAVEGYNTLEVFLPREAPDHSEDDILIDWFDIEYWRELWAADDQIVFGSSGSTGIVKYSIGGFTDTEAAAFKVVDRYTVRTVPGVGTEGSSSGFRVVFQDDVADTASYVTVSDAGYLTPGIERDSFADLRTPTGADYIMIAHDGFYDEATRLKSFRESQDGGGFAVRLVRISDVYDEFSWGLQDPTAIRDFLKHTWEGAVVPPTHALLIGDTSSDYRGYFSSSIPCFVPAHYATAIGYWPADPWFVGFDAAVYYHMGMALGRLPARSTGELNTMIDKVIRYETEQTQGLWKNTAILVGDDEYKTGQPDYCCEFYHTEQAEQISTEILPWPIDREKVYLMEYESDAAGRKPAARTDIIDAWNRGALLMNYTGHGNEIVLAHESVFLFDDVSLLKNIDGLPLFFAASCRLNKFDQQTVDSMGELLLKSGTGGSIVSIGSTRDSGAGQNSALNRRFLAATFGNQQEQTTPALDVGMAFQAAFTTDASTWANNTRFLVLGDPALTLAAPRGGGAFDEAGVEPLRRRDTVTLSGESSGVTAGLDGAALVTVTDCADTSGFVHTSPPPVYRVVYSLPGDTVYEGPVSVDDGALSAQFVVSSASAEGPYARVRAYCYGSDEDGAFSFEEVALTDSVIVSDAEGPEIAVEFEGGGTSVLPGTEVTITLSDEHGINLVDRDPSDAIVVSFDGRDSLDVTGEFAYEFGSYRDGMVEHELPTLALGEHTIQVAASDNVGNRATATQWFEVVSAAEFKVRNVASSPNPFPDGDSEGTYILFQLPVDAEVGIDVFTVGGRLVRRIEEFRASAGANQVYWDGRDQQGDELANGVYLYRIHAVSLAYRGDRADAIGRAVVMR